MGFGVRASPVRDDPGDPRNPGDKPIGDPAVEKKFARFGVTGGGADVVLCFSIRVGFCCGSDNESSAYRDVLPGFETEHLCVLDCATFPSTRDMILDSLP